MSAAPPAATTRPASLARLTLAGTCLAIVAIAIASLLQTPALSLLSETHAALLVAKLGLAVLYFVAIGPTFKPGIVPSAGYFLAVLMLLKTLSDRRPGS